MSGSTADWLLDGSRKAEDCRSLPLVSTSSTRPHACIHERTAVMSAVVWLGTTSALRRLRPEAGARGRSLAARVGWVSLLWTQRVVDGRPQRCRDTSPAGRRANLTATVDYALIVGAAPATRESRDVGLPASQPTTADGAARLEIGEEQGVRRLKGRS